MLCLPTLLCAALFQEPLTSQLPKEDLGVAAFLEKYPQYNGKGIRVAVLDTGVDPGHPYLQKNPDGSRKIVDWYDATTDGRLTIQHRAKAENGTLMGLSGRRLDLGAYAAPGREFGLIRLDQDFMPDDLEHRLQGERSEDWKDEKRGYQERQARIQGESEETTLAAQEERYYNSFNDVGPVWDMIVFESNGQKMVVIDNDEDGNLGEEPALRAFAASGDWATLGDEALLNYCVSFDGEDGVHLYFDAHGHGTHVAGIIGAYEGEGGRLNGVAPGVEFVAIKIGDGKFGGSTSGFAITKALDYAVEAGCQVANISFGGPSFFADGLEPDGWVVEEATRRGLCVVTSAGNEGPTLTTVGAPATTSAAFSIAAAIWPGTQRANYSSLTPSEPVLFDFSSRGPLPTGDLGIDYAAPGAALSALPSWGITLGENWNGTSMAAPQIAGCIALLRGAAQNEGWAHDPVRIDRALRLSAKPLPQHAWVEQGHGFVSVPAAYEALGQLHQGGFEDQLYSVRVANPFGEGAGVYLRGMASMMEPLDVVVRVKPLFDDEVSNATQSEFLRTYRPEPEAAWVTGPDIFYSSAQGQAFKLRLNCEDLKPGLHSTRVLIYDVDQPREFGPEIVLPVTVIIPDITAAASEHRYQHLFELKPGELKRHFLDVPYGATKAKIRVTQFGGARNEIRSGAGSLSGFLYPGDRQTRGRFFLQDGETYETIVPVEAGTVLEYTMASRWATNLEAEYLLEVQYVGVVPQDSELVLPAGQNLAYLGLKNTLGSGAYSVSAKVEGVAIPVTAEIEITPDPIRQTVMGERGLFYGTRSWTSEIPDSGADVVLHMPKSIQTIELREDLMLYVRDANGQIIKRKIAYEVDTPVGHLDGGSYSFELIYPSIGLTALEAAFAGAELRLKTGGGSMTPSNTLQAALESSGGGRLSIPFGGARTAYFTAPKLDPVDDGRYYYGTASVKSGQDTLLNVPLQIRRPLVAAAAPEIEEEEGPSASIVSLEVQEGEEEKEDPIAAARTKFEEAASADAASVASLKAAWEWTEAAPMCFEAELAVLHTLSAAGLHDYAQHRAKGYLQRFPMQVQDFLAAAPSWNP